MRVARDLIGQVFGRLTVQYRVPGNPKPQWVCSCSCGGTTVQPSGALLGGRSKSCGCYRNELASRLNRTHGMSGTPIYNVWCSMIARCRDTASQHWANYGGRGITVCQQWSSFEEFFKDMGSGYAPGLEINRVDNDLGYYQGNCEWTTHTENVGNRRNTVTVVVGGALCTLAKACRSHKVPYERTRKRISEGWDVLDALTVPDQSLGRYRDTEGKFVAQAPHPGVFA